jgi:hypothetical protein
MSEQPIDTGADAATSRAADPSEGLGTADPGAQRGSGGGTGRAHAETGEVSADPNPDRRAEDPGTVATEFGDRADTAPEDDIAHPSI